MHESPHNEREWNGSIRIKSDQVRTIEFQKVKIFPKSHHSLSKMGTYISVQIIETLLRLDLYTRETYEPDSDTIL